MDILYLPVLGCIDNSISVMVRAASLTATFRPSWDLRSHVPGDTSDPDKSPNGVFNPDHRIRAGFLYPPV